MSKFLAHGAKHACVRVAPMLLTLLILAGASLRMGATTLFFSGNLRTDANVFDCGCTLDSSNSDGDYAQYAAVVDSFNVAATSTMSAITYSYGGGTSSNGTVVAPGGLEPYLSLFDGSGDLLGSTYSSSCPLTANLYDGNCFDVSLDGGTLSAGNYFIALTDYPNMSFAENSGSGNLSDGFTTLATLQPDEDLHYAFDVILTPTSTSPVPEPNFTFLVGTALAASFFLRGMKLRADTHA